MPVLWEEHKKYPNCYSPRKRTDRLSGYFYIRYFKAFLHKCKVSVKNLQEGCNMQTQTGG